jgi:hypothetical protein
MGKLSWYFNRLRAMSLPEVGWRLQQKRLQDKEKKAFASREIMIIDDLFDHQLASLSFHPYALGLNFKNQTYSTSTSIHLLGGYSYEQYKERWNAGFQTDNVWDNEFSYSLTYKQRDDIGDARTNWELNRHFQFALLGKAYYVTGEKQYLDEFTHLFYDWNEKNPFLHGISWTSVMEVAIRCIQWCLSLAFLQEKGNVNKKLLSDLEIGIKNMAEYVDLHHSRFSSANNHLLVEATAIAFAGFAFDYAPWKKLAIEVLDSELLKQNYEDGVNKEMSLHYQTFGMEAYALVMHLMQANGMSVPVKWKEILERQCEFVAYSMVSETRACEFGDNDEGKIIDLEGGEINHYRYVLQLCSLVLDRRYESFINLSETVSWMFSSLEINRCKAIKQYEALKSKTFKSGGYSFLKSNDKRVVLAIDHAPLGFGSIAAHGHADALSIQLFVDGDCILGDPGTYIYHCDIKSRNYFRRTCNHNTLCIDDKEQSQMLGAFLWGKKAKSTLIKSDLQKDNDEIIAECDGYRPIMHRRKIHLDKKNDSITIFDNVSKTCNYALNFIVAPGCNVELRDSSIEIKKGNVQVVIDFESAKTVKKENVMYSTHYGLKCQSSKFSVESLKNSIITKIRIIHG